MCLFEIYLSNIIRDFSFDFPLRPVYLISISFVLVTPISQNSVAPRITNISKPFMQLVYVSTPDVTARGYPNICIAWSQYFATVAGAQRRFSVCLGPQISA